VGEKSHVVAVADLSPEGAFLATRAQVQPGQSLTLRVVVPRDGRVMSLPCQVVRQSERAESGAGRRAGVAVRFKGPSAAAVHRMEEFAMEGFLPSAEPTPQEHFEYRLLERASLDAEELNRLGLDGWRLVSALPSGKGVQLVLMRRL
jgi:hypothetical protein